MPHRDDPESAGRDHVSNLRNEARVNLLLRPAKLVGRGRDYLCVLRDVSSGGCKVRLFHPLPEDPGLSLELGNGELCPVEPVWEQDNHAGLRFLRPVPVGHLINDHGVFRKRPVRLRLSHQPALLVIGGERKPVILQDISQQGARLECSAHVAVDQQVRLEIPNGPAIVAKVRWRRAGSVGLVFEQTFRLDELARLVIALHSGLPAVRSRRTVP